MSDEIRKAASFELSTRDLKPSVGLTSLQDLFDTKVQLQFHASADQRIDAHMTVFGLPGVRYARMDSSMEVSLVRHRQMLADQEDDLCLIMSKGDPLSIEQGGRQSCAMNGDAVLLDYREPAILSFKAMRYAAVRVRHAALAPLTRGALPTTGHHIGSDSSALGLLRAYLDALPDRIVDGDLLGLVAAHVHDLMALAIGATREGAEVAANRGVKAARLQAAQALLKRDHSLSILEIARRQGVSPRYLQKLFEESGTTFSAFVLDQRLDVARAMLVSPRFRHWKIIAIAQEAGFGDLSYFNRRFRARFNLTPSDVRAHRT